MSRYIQYGGYQVTNPSDKLAMLNESDDEDEYGDSTSEEENYEMNDNEKAIEEARQVVLGNKSSYYNYLMDNAPQPLDQSPVLTDVVKNDMNSMAKILQAAGENGFNKTPYFFKSSVTIMSNKNNVNVPQEELEKFATELKKKGLESIVACREALRSLNSRSISIDTCNDIIEDIFVRYMWSLVNTAREEE
jgi:hypothetical protein